MTTHPALSLRVDFADGARLGPGKAALLALIAETGSIAAAGRRMGMSYRRAWALVETLNASFGVELVSRARGGPGRGGARLTDAGAAVLARYRGLCARAREAAADDLAALDALRADGCDALAGDGG